MYIRCSVFVLIALAAFGLAGVTAAQWLPLDNDRLHDPSNPALDVLQEPAEALGVLQPDSAGNRVDWVTSLRRADINPRSSLNEEPGHQVLDQDVLMTNTLPARFVKFPHRAHTEWMSCENCHERIFVSRSGANPINMARILEGDYCGVCHGAVAFPLTECDRCHNTDSSRVGSASRLDDRGPPER